MDKLIVYDFDDTLFPSYPYVMHLISVQNVKLFKLIDDIISAVLSYSCSIADVMILSDGDSSWLKEVLSHLPKSKKIIKEKVSLISTVVFYSERHRLDVMMYKYYYLSQEIDLKKYSMIINIGDGVNELRASNMLKNDYNIKHIKLYHQPVLSEWVYEMNNIIKAIEFMIKDKETYYEFDR